MEQEKKWHALYVKSRAEKKVCGLLLDKGIEAYVPVKKEMRQWSDRKKTIQVPLISGYVFVKESMAVKDTVLNTNGVVSFVRYNGTEAVIRQAEIDTLKSIEAYGYEIDVMTEDFEKGDKIRIYQGPFKGLAAYVLSSEGDRITCVFEVEGIRQEFRIRLPKEFLKKE